MLIRGIDYPIYLMQLKCMQKINYGVVRDFTGHGVGSKLHEDPAVPNYGKEGMGPVLRKGMTLAIEPMINMGTYKVKY